MRIRTFFLALLGVCMVLSYNVKAADDEIDADADPLNPGKKPPRIFVGPVAGYNRSLHTGGFASISKGASCPTFEQGTENGFYLGLTAEFLLGDVKNSKSSIIARVLYDYQPAFFTVPGDKYPSKLADGTEITTEIEHTTAVKYTLLNIEVMYKFNIPGTFLGITAGPQFGFPIGGSQEQRYQLVFDPSKPVQFPISVDSLAGLPVVNDFKPRFLDETRTSIVLYEGDIIQQSSFRAGFKLGLQYEILLGRVMLVPSAYYNMGLTRINTRDNWRVNAFQIGADLRFAL
jgi:hypothetical protein